MTLDILNFAIFIAEEFSILENLLLLTVKKSTLHCDCLGLKIILKYKIGRHCAVLTNAYSLSLSHTRVCVCVCIRREWNWSMCIRKRVKLIKYICTHRKDNIFVGVIDRTMQILSKYLIKLIKVNNLVNFLCSSNIDFSFLFNYVFPSFIYSDHKWYSLDYTKILKDFLIKT